MKKNSIISFAVASLWAFNVNAADTIKISGEACEKFLPDQSKSSIRVRVTDKASYEAVRQIEEVEALHAQMLEHDFNVIIYNLVDNYLQDLNITTTRQSQDELCVKVTGKVLPEDVKSVIDNYTPSNPAPEYDIREAAGIMEETLDEPEEKPEPEEAAPAEVLYDGIEEIKAEAEIKAQETEQAEVLYQGEGTENNPYADENIGELPPPPENDLSAENIKTASNEDKSPAVSDTAYIFVAPVLFNNNTHSSKPSQVLKDMFADVQGYQLIDKPNKANYILEPRVMKAKIDALNAKTKRMQMVVALQLRQAYSSISYSEHQNRFVLFENGEDEQEIAQKLLHKLLRNSGRKLFFKIENAEKKRKAGQK